MAIVIEVNGNGSGEGFLLAPDGARTFPVPIGLRTDDGTTVAATVQQAPGGAVLVFSSTSVSIGPSEQTINVHATTASTARNDTVIQIVVGGVVQASFNLTAITDPQVWFQGRFQARFATDNDYYNDPRGTTSWSFTLTGEPDFVPADSVPTTITKPVGREIRFHNPVALRSHVPPVGVAVTVIQGTAGATVQQFVVGDPVIGVPVDLGPHTYFASNQPKNPVDPAPAESYSAGWEVMALFELHLGTLFGATSLPASRPISGIGFVALSASEIAQYGIGNLATYGNTRKTQLINDYNALSAADQAATVGQNLLTRIGHLGGDGSLGVAASTPTFAPAWGNKEEFSGLVDDQILFAPNNSTVLSYFAGYNSFVFFGKFMNFHSDDQSGQIHGNVAVDPGTGIPPLTTGVYNIQRREAASFTPLNAGQLTQAAVDGILAAGSMADTVVVSVSGNFNRLVVSKAVIANPGDAPASWTIASRGDSLVGRLLPDISVFPRDYIYEILPPGDEDDVLGGCEGNLFAPGPAFGFARLSVVGGTWNLLVNAGTLGGNGITYSGPFSGATATIPTGCTPADVEVLTPSIDFGNVEEGLTMYREIELLNRSAGAVTISLPALASPFGAPSDTSVVIQPGDAGRLLVSFAAGTPGAVGPVPITLSSAPVVAGSLDATLSGTSTAVTKADIVLVMDRSGSMSDPAISGFRVITKSELRNRAAQMLVDLLRPDDRIGMVRFNEDAQLHMALEAAGVEMTGTGRIDAATALASADLNPSGATSVGDGMNQANTMLTAPSAADSHAMLVLTDGVENSPAFISDVVLGGGIGAYAVGFGLPQNVNVDKLSAITGNTGGYLLVTGDIDAANDFRLHKYFAQILSGITADAIVVDPSYEIGPGEIQRVPFYISEADSQFDAVLLTHFRPLRFWLEAPDGTRITPTNVAAFNGQYVEGRECRYYRMKLPVFVNQFVRSYGKWNIVIQYAGRKRAPQRQGQTSEAASAAGQDPKSRLTTVFDERRAYNVLVRARSAIQMDAGVQQEGCGPGATREVVAHLRGFGLPLHQGVVVRAEVTRPDGVITRIPLRHAGDGVFTAGLDTAKLLGTYQVVVRASGQTPGNFPLQRELTVTGVVIDPTAKNESDILATELGGLIKQEQAAIDQLLAAVQALTARCPMPAGGIVPPRWLLGIVALMILLLLIVMIMIARL